MTILQMAIVLYLFHRALRDDPAPALAPRMVSIAQIKTI